MPNRMKKTPVDSGVEALWKTSARTTNIPCARYIIQALNCQNLMRPSVMNAAHVARPLSSSRKPLVVSPIPATSPAYMGKMFSTTDRAL